MGVTAGLLELLFHVFLSIYVVGLIGPELGSTMTMPDCRTGAKIPTPSILCLL
jgi:hypothetical protein